MNYLTAPDAEFARGEMVHIAMRDKKTQVNRTKRFRRDNAKAAQIALARLQKSALSDTENVFEELLRTVEVATVGQVTDALWEVWGRFRPSM